MAQNDRSNWYVDKIEIELNKYGDNKGTYEGRIRFQNNDLESFAFKLRPGQIEPFLELIKYDLVKTADKLTSDLIDGLKLRETTLQTSYQGGCGSGGNIASPYVVTPKKTIIEKAIDLAESAGLVTKKEPL